MASADVFAFVAEQRTPRRENVVRIEDGEAGLSARTIARRHVERRGLVRVSDRPWRCWRGSQSGAAWSCRPPCGSARPWRGAAGPAPADVAEGALAGRGRQVAWRAADAAGPSDRAGDAAGGAAALRGARVAASGYQPGRAAAVRRFGARAVASGSCRSPARFFEALGAYLGSERPPEAVTDACFVVLKGPRRGLPLSAAGLDEVIDGARGRAGLARLTCHMLRHTCLTRLREQGMSLEALQAQAGMRRSTRPGSICTSRTTGWRASICGRRRRSRRRSTRPPRMERRHRWPGSLVIPRSRR